MVSSRRKQNFAAVRWWCIQEFRRPTKPYWYDDKL